MEPHLRIEVIELLRGGRYYLPPANLKNTKGGRVKGQDFDDLQEDPSEEIEGNVHVFVPFPNFRMAINMCRK